MPSPPNASSAPLSPSAQQYQRKVGSRKTRSTNNYSRSIIGFAAKPSARPKGTERENRSALNTTIRCTDINGRATFVDTLPRAWRARGSGFGSIEKFGGGKFGASKVFRPRSARDGETDRRRARPRSSRRRPALRPIRSHSPEGRLRRGSGASR